MKNQTKQNATDIINNQREHVVAKILEDMQRDGLHWAEPYLPSLSPNNPASGTVYQGGNRVHLAFIGYMRGFTDSRWCTFNQIRDAGWHLKKGAKAAMIEKWKTFPIFEENEITGEKELTGQYPKLIGYWNVFNASEIEGIPPQLNAEMHKSDATAEIAANLKLSSRCPVKESPLYAGSAAYAPHSDRILIAPRNTFRSDESFTRILLHEMTHSTGHPDALNRPSNTDFGSPEYAEEELVAELGSLFLSADLGIQTEDYEGEYYENHVSYLQSWMKALSDDPSYLFKAASKADKADTYIKERYENVLSLQKEKGVPERAAELSQGVSLETESKAMRDASKEQGSDKTADERDNLLENEVVK